MKKDAKHNIRLGFFVLSALVLFVLAIYYLGQKKNLFKSVVKINTYFSDIKGLQVGNNVRFSGINVGIVSDISLVSDTAVIVEMTIEKEVQQFIRVDSKVEIRNEGLMGNKILVIYPGSSDMPSVKTDDMLTSKTTINIEDMLKQAETILFKAETFMDQAIDITEKVNRGEGNLGKLVNDSSFIEFLNQAGYNLSRFASDAQEITEKINSGQGDLARMLNDSSFSIKLKAMMYDMDSAATFASQSSEQLLKTIKDIETKKGPLNKLIYDSAFSEQLDTTILELNQSIKNLNGSMETIEKSWILNVFSGNKKDKKMNKQKE